MKYFLPAIFWFLSFFTIFYLLFIGYDGVVIFFPIIFLLYYFSVERKKFNLIPNQNKFIELYKKSFLYILFFKDIKNDHAYTSNYKKRSTYYTKNIAFIFLVLSLFLLIITRPILIPDIEKIETQKAYIKKSYKNYFSNYFGLSVVEIEFIDGMIKKYFCHEKLKTSKIYQIINYINVNKLYKCIFMKISKKFLFLENMIYYFI